MVYIEEYLYGLSLFVAAVVNFVLAAMLLFDSNNYLYTETPRYLRSRRLTGASLMVFGIGFLLHWLFMPHFSNLMMGKALSFSYFHIGGVLFSMSHTSLIDRKYLTRRVVVRDTVALLLSLGVYWNNAFMGIQLLTYLGSALFFVHIGYLTWQFYRRFHRIYRQLGRYADYRPNDTDHEVLWLHNSCHLIIAFGIGGMLCTVLFHDAVLPFTILLFMGVAVFSYIYKALDSFGAIARDAEVNIQESEIFVRNNNSATTVLPAEGGGDADTSIGSERIGELKTIVDRWVAARHYTDPDLTIQDTLNQMDISLATLNYYILTCTDQKGYRQWLPVLRIEESKRIMLEHPEYSLQAIAEACGYSNNANFTRAFKEKEGIPPSKWIVKNVNHGE